MSDSKPLTYKDAGVDIDGGNALVERIKPAVKSTQRTGVMGSVGGFGGAFDLSALNYKAPVLVSGTDGVGTKLMLAQRLNDHSGIGIDLVAMCVNDILAMGAEPLFFLDYYACGRLQVEQAAQVIQGIAEGCRLAGCALIGGETAEMPGMYDVEDYDLAGFVVGAVEKDRLIDGAGVRAGQVLVGVDSTGPHANGYSLIRKILELSNADLEQRVGDTTLAQALLHPTRIYVRPVLSLLHDETPIRAIAHITGGGLLENIVRVIPADLSIEIDASSWQMPAVFEWLQHTGQIETHEMRRTFNCGIGLVLVCEADAAAHCINALQSQQFDARVIGAVTEGTGQRVRFRD